MPPHEEKELNHIWPSSLPITANIGRLLLLAKRLTVYDACQSSRTASRGADCITSFPSGRKQRDSSAANISGNANRCLDRNWHVKVIQRGDLGVVEEVIEDRNVLNIYSIDVAVATSSNPCPFSTRSDVDRYDRTGCPRQDGRGQSKAGTMMCWIARKKRMRNTATPVIMLLIPLVLATCGSPEPVTSQVAAAGRAEPVTSQVAAVGRAQPAPPGLQQAGTETLSTRLVALDRAVSRWQAASTLRVAHEAAEEARNLIVGASGPFYGDANRDGQIAGASVVGILPGLNWGASLASPNDNACVVADVLGGSWREPATRWSEFHSALSRWTISRNTFPSLPSHAQRVVGWASLTLKSDSPVEAREYAQHARLHVDIAIRAVNSCRR